MPVSVSVRAQAILLLCVAAGATHAQQDPAAGAAAAPDAVSGLHVETIPSGAQVLIDGVDGGTTPLRRGGVALGTRHLRILRDSYEPLELDVDVSAGQSTVITAELRTLRSTSEATYQVLKQKHDDDVGSQWWKVAGYSAGGGLVTLIGIPIIAAGVVGSAEVNGKPVLGPEGQQVSQSVAVVGVISCIVGVGIIGLGVKEGFTTYDEPVADWTLPRTTTVQEPHVAPRTVATDVLVVKAAPPTTTASATP